MHKSRAIARDTQLGVVQVERWIRLLQPAGRPTVSSSSATSRLDIRPPARPPACLSLSDSGRRSCQNNRRPDTTMRACLCRPHQLSQGNKRAPAGTRAAARRALVVAATSLVSSPQQAGLMVFVARRRDGATARRPDGAIVRWPQAEGAHSSRGRALRSQISPGHRDTPVVIAPAPPGYHSYRAPGLLSHLLGP